LSYCSQGSFFLDGDTSKIAREIATSPDLAVNHCIFPLVLQQRILRHNITLGGGLHLSEND